MIHFCSCLELLTVPCVCVLGARSRYMRSVCLMSPSPCGMLCCCSPKQFSGAEEAVALFGRDDSGDCSHRPH